MKRGCCAFLLVLLAATALKGERFLTASEAQRLCFPRATAFESMTLALSRNEIDAVQKKIGAKLRSGIFRYSRALEGTNILGFIFFDHVIGKHELIDYAIALSPEGAVNQVEILEYRENFGGEIRREKWRGQFKGKRSADPLKLNKDISNITGATLSCRHVTEGVKKILAVFDVGGNRLPNG